MRLLLDTHVLIWWAGGTPLAASVATAIGSAREVAISAASVWEAEIKAATGRLVLEADLAREPQEHGFRALPITAEHGVAAARLPLHHRDPFDRMLVAQAQVEGLTLVTRDPIFSRYDVPVLAA